VTIEERLPERTKDNLKRLKRDIEKLSRKDIEELMGMNKPTYKRGKGGAIRRR